MEFEWDSRKAVANRKKHGITFHEAATVFGDPLAYTFADPNHSLNEERFITFGMSRQNRLILVSHTFRDNKLRIINARRMTPQEKKIYEE